MAEFTKGSWKPVKAQVEIAGQDFEVYEIEASAPGFPYWIAYVQCLDDQAGYEGVAEANANLIAAAPAMYEALKELVDDMDAVIAGGDWYGGSTDKAKDALALAEGGKADV